jgi:hypothetical protein
MTNINREFLKTDILGQLIFQSGVQAEKDSGQKVHFYNGYAYTFDDERINIKKCPIDYNGTAPIKLLIAALGGNEENVTITWKDGEKNEIKLTIKNGNTRTRLKGTPANTDVFAQHDLSKLNWHDVGHDILEQRELLEATVSKNVTNFQLSSIHCSPDYFEAASESQICRIYHKLPSDFEFLIRYGVIKNVFRGAQIIAKTPEYVYFKFHEGLVTGIRIFEEKYLSSISKQIEKERTGVVVELPDELATEIATAKLFTDENQSVVCTISENTFLLGSENQSGEFIAKAKIDYTGETKSFTLKAEVLTYVFALGHKCIVTEDVIRIEDPGKLIFLTSIISR